MVRIARKLEQATFLDRENRFVGTVDIQGQIHKCHILNPGRMVKFLIPGAQVLVENRSNPKRKLDYSLLYVIHPESLILIDSQVPNAIINEGLNQKKLEPFLQVRKIRREVPYGNNKKSRIDFLLDDNIFLEVKATNYESDQIGYFPDAPTTRGQRHVKELIQLAKSNSHIKCNILFLAQRTDIHSIRPFDEIDPVFGQLLREAEQVGVRLLAYSIAFEEDGKKAILGDPIPVELPNLPSLDEN
ncbi:MAG: DNA/RNA nuclease SfsA [Promethearchaeota archaeon]